MSWYLGGDNTVPTTECNTWSVFLAPLRWHGISPIWIQVHIFSVQRTSFQILQIVRYSGQACWSPKKLLKWILSDSNMTSTLFTSAGSWSGISHLQAPLSISLYIQLLPVSMKLSSSKLRYSWNGKCARRNCVHFKISLEYNVFKIYKWSSIQQSSPRPKYSLESSFARSSAIWNDSMLKLSSPCLRCWSTYSIVRWLDYLACWKSHADQNGCHGFHCSEYLRCLLYDPVALRYAFPRTYSTPTACLWAFVLVGSGVNVRSGFWGSIFSLWGVSSGGGAPGILSLGRWLVD